MNRTELLEHLRERAQRALSKAAPFGPDIDITQFVKSSPLASVRLADALASAKSVGVNPESARISALYYQIDSRIEILRSLLKGVDIEPLDRALEERFDEVKQFFWRAVPVDLDKYTAITFLKGIGGYFIRVKRGTVAELPIQTCFFMSGGAQLVHNIVVVEENAKAVIVTGCTIMPEALGLHVGITEIYLERGAQLIDVMIHSWNRTTHVRPRTGVVVKDGATYVSYYINMSTTKTLQTRPTITLVGEGARTYSASILLGLADSHHDVGSHVIARGRSSRAELVSKIVARDSSRIVSRLRIDAEAEHVKGFTECSAVLLSDQASVETVPELYSKSSTAELHHEASIGKLRDEEIEYLVLKGFSPREAISILIRGFINVDLSFLTPEIRKSIEKVLDTLAERGVS